MRSLLLLFAFIFAVALGFAPAEARPAPPVSVDRAGLAIGGYDPTAYFSAGRAVLGTPANSLRWKGATWRFASAEAKARFAAAPQRYAPQFGGYCAWAVSQGYLAPGDGRQWRIVDGRLYLNYNARAKKLWEANLPDLITQGKANWPGVLTSNQNS